MTGQNIYISLSLFSTPTNDDNGVFLSPIWASVLYTVKLSGHLKPEENEAVTFT